MVSSPSRPRWALYVALIVPLNNRHGAESSPVGVVGDGSKGVPRVVRLSVPAAASPVEIAEPKAA
jgi:hypothetical protein